MSRRDPLIRSLEVIVALAAILYSALIFAEDTDTIAVLRGFGLTETQARVVAAAAEKSGKGEDYGPLRALLGNADVPVVLGAAALLMEAEEAFEKDAVALLRSGNGNRSLQSSGECQLSRHP